MQYRKFGRTGVEVSALGFGCMRFPLIQRDGEERVDEEQAAAMLRYGIDHGLNYVDTAYPYLNGKCEAAVGRALQDGYREKVYLATKSPVWLLKEEEDFDRILEEQLERLQTEYIDFYLLHALDQERFVNIVLNMRLLDHLEAAKAAGKIRHIGFSFHDSFEVFKKIVDYYSGWEFCQIQYNYADTEHQAGRKGLQYAASKGLGVVIMEPLRGGKLAAPATHLADVFPKERTPVEWGLDFLWNQPEVSLVLSGMNSMKQVEDNLSYASRSAAGMLDTSSEEMYRKAGEIFNTMALVKCTHCEYCLPCPSGLNIPEIFSIYNQSATDGMDVARKKYALLDKKADECIRCRCCEKACPQHIGVSAMMLDIGEELEA